MKNSGSQSSNYKNTEAQTMSENSNSNKLLLPKILVCDGKINKNSLTKVNHDTEWITNKLKEYGIDDMKKVLIAFFDTQGNFKYQLFDNYTKENTQNEK
ncbi:YetF domain-containing protein [uncultured Clostridium sp.]|uniref:YetF domain-containing protein n=1 Tax=uncultured Clostridium sp. TaxID=59620 RepID=UPI00338FF20E